MMDFFKRHFISFFVYVACGVLTVAGIYFYIQKQNKYHALSAVEKIRAKGRLCVITNPSIDSYYTYENRPMGFEYDLVKEFSSWLQVELKVITPGWENMFPYLDKGKGDMIAAGVPITPERFEKYNFSVPYMSITQRIVHHSLDTSPSTIEDMKGRTFHLSGQGAWQFPLTAIRESGIRLDYVLHNNISQYELISMVYDRSIKYTIANSNVALLSRRYYPDISVGIAVGKKQSMAWAVRKNDTSLLMEMNRFFISAHQNGLLERIKNKYYHHIEKIDVFDIKQFNKRLETRFPEYKKLIQQESVKYHFDWRLITAVIYQESHFDPDATSRTNVQGLMQVTTSTAKEMGITNRRKPSQSIKAGIKYLDKMYKKFDHIQDEYQRMIFALASYNVGYGHVLDAIEIAKEKGYNHTHWQGLKKALPLLARPRYYKKTKYGYARGWEPVQYVDRILTYFDILRHQEAKVTLQQ